MEAILGHLNFDYRRFTAVDHVELASNPNYLASTFDQVENFKTNQSILLKQTYNRDLSLGQVSCWLSYLLLFSQLASVSISKRPILILEDDVDVEVDFVNQLNEAISSAPPDWDVLLCGYFYLQGDNYTDTKFQRVNDYAGTHCQLVRDSSVAARLVQKLDLITIEKPVDLILGNLAGSRYLNFYALKDQLAVQMRHVFKTEIYNSGATVQYTLKNSLVQYLKNHTLINAYNN
jgi:GR25 family glycosyltransferase involved in LPS biosynthesis